jgi:hypothetical protein
MSGGDEAPCDAAAHAMPAAHASFDEGSAAKRVRTYGSGASVSSQPSSDHSFPLSAHGRVSAWQRALRGGLSSLHWFAHVDEVLMQNAFMSMIANSQRQSPSEHLFLTASQLFQSRQ